MNMLPSQEFKLWDPFVSDFKKADVKVVQYFKQGNQV